MLKKLFLLRMPEEIRLPLCTMHDASLDQLAQPADRMMDAKNAYSCHKVFGNSLKISSATRQHEYLKSKIDVLETKIDSFIGATKNIQGDHFKTFNQPHFSHSARKLPKSTLIVGDVDHKTKSPLPHIYAYKCNQLCLIDTGAEISVVTPNQEDKNSRTSDLPLVAANGSSITTYSNRRMTLQLK